MRRDLIIFTQEGIGDHYKLKEILGKKVITYKGVVIGKVSDIAFTRKKVLGFYISGVFKRYFVSLDYVDAFSGESLMLTIDPVTRLKGKLVFDKDGEKLGKVVEIKRPSFENKITEILVRKNIFTKPFVISSADLEVVDKNIILNKTFENEPKK